MYERMLSRLREAQDGICQAMSAIDGGHFREHQWDRRASFRATGLSLVLHPHNPAFYPRFKTWCDEYFFLKHRGEARGVGGVFFDDLRDRSREELFAFASDSLDVVVPAYAPIPERRHSHRFTEEEKRWQALRRGRYVEFNLVWDRGTLFGLRTDARVESVLMSLPLTAAFGFAAKPVGTSRR